MRSVAPLVFCALALASNSWAFKFEDIHLLAKRSVDEATEWLKDKEYEGVVNGTAFSSRRGTKCSPASQEMDRRHHIYERALDILEERHNVSKREAHRVLRQASNNFCKRPSIRCVNSKYRTIDGSCNNPQVPWWGMSETSQDRLLRPYYFDGRNSPRGNFQSGLPNPRFISTFAHPDLGTEFNGITNMVPQFGQFLDHDISLTPEANKKCCTGEQDANCWSIPIPSDDYFYAPKRQTCMDFTRSTPCTNPDSGVREQVNMNTAFIDGSQIYGSTNDRARQLRSFQGGQLLINTAGSSSLHVPFVTQTRADIQGAFAAGDDRINEMPGLAVMHNLFLREHNRIARYLQANARRPMSDEELYQEARRIVIAELQVITYNEYLPLVLGKATMDKYGLTLFPGSVYEVNTNPTVLNSFSTAAYRFGHTLVSNVIKMLNSVTRAVFNTYEIKNHYNQPTVLTADGGRGYDYILTGLIESNAQNYDVFVVEGLNNFLLAQPNGAFGSDLIARNIQRGRDHGLPPYNDFRAYCGLPTVNFNSPPADMLPGAWDVLRKAYNGIPANIDLFSGGLHELPANGGISGATFQCIKRFQFYRLKYGDRYFVTHGNQDGSFNPQQLNALLNRRLSDVICQNSLNRYTQLNVFYAPNPNTNPQVLCTDPSRNLNLNLFLP